MVTITREIATLSMYFLADKLNVYGALIFTENIKAVLMHPKGFDFTLLTF